MIKFSFKDLLSIDHEDLKDKIFVLTSNEENEEDNIKYFQIKATSIE